MPIAMGRVRKSGSDGVEKSLNNVDLEKWCSGIKWYVNRIENTLEDQICGYSTGNESLFIVRIVSILMSTMCWKNAEIFMLDLTVILQITRISVTN